MNKKKIIFSLVFVFALIFGLNINSKAADDKYTADDFVIVGDTVYGFSKSGVQKLKRNRNVVLPTKSKENVDLKKIASFAFVHDKSSEIDEYTQREGENGEINNLDVDGNEIKKLGEDFGQLDIESVEIPKGYTYIGQDAFRENKNIKSVNLPNSIIKISDYAFADLSLKTIKLPDNLEFLGDQVFFYNQIEGKLILPKNLTNLGERSFKSNQITELEFNCEKLEIIKEQAFEDNKIKQAKLPDSVKKIEIGAFNGNLGDENYAMKVVLFSNGNVDNKDSSSIVNPTEEDKTTSVDVDSSKWDEKDFVFDKGKVLGFSGIGKLKVRKNKDLVIPEKNGKYPIDEIGDDAFRNVDFEGSSLNKYDLKSIKLPKTVKKIGKFAFQSNYLTDFEAPEALKIIGDGAFMNNKIETLELSEKTEIIGSSAFHINKLFAIVIYPNVREIGISAFRNNDAQNVMFMGDKVEKIGEMAFCNNKIDELDLSLLTKLKEIPVQAFYKNSITKVTMPENLESVKEEAFRYNNLKEIDFSNKIKEIKFNAFDDNKVGDNYKKVLVKIKGKTLADGNNFVVNPEETTKNKDDLKKVLDELNKLDLTELRDDTQKQFEDMKAEGEKLLKQDKLSEGAKLKYIHDTQFFINRYKLDSLIKKGELTIKNNPQNTEILKDKLEYAKKSYNNSAVVDNKLTRLTKELQNLINIVENKGNMADSIMKQGHFELKTPLPIPSYHIGMNVYFDKNGKILYVLDMSYTIGKGQKDEYGNEILNVDEDNEGYHMLALETLDDYEGLNYSDILKSNVDSLGKIRKVDDRAKYHREGIFEAIKDACKDFEKENITKPGKKNPTKPEKPGKEDPAKPGKEDPTKPGKENPANPGTTTPSNPGTTTPSNPGTVTPSVPGTTTPETPAQTTKETTKETTRVAGADRINTAVEVSKKYYKSAETVIIANYEKFADSLSASALSKALKAPILLVKKDQLDSVVAQEIKRLGAKNVVVIGGEQSVDEAKNSLSKYNVQTIAGSDRYETSAKIAQEIIKRTGTTQAVIASGETFADALTVAPLANKNNMPILLVQPNNIPKATQEVLKQINKAIIVGGEKTISKEVANKLPNATRIAGANRYETAKKIYEYGFKDRSEVNIANGTNFADSLVIGSIDCPILLAESNEVPESTKQAIKDSKFEKVNVFGGENSIDESVVKELIK
ncbi:leucine-rich repeat protein [Finegoldia magna]|uniref:Putative N-acetylmuramoyl-L-alanine amidase n=1 Tax=Finegoldia magna (strain ATCC 29328 / DSM 20472 / WAL 2508) TaxID=334413 RepID=B0S3D3_FINM2|nr:leucine-rich repeat protein [Finegoldia magna]UEA69785.1 leucine-rich repeat protein [Finegoldia magna]BAG08873.1 putative N-acetylmuramoyl-L-alanine amidase [Finegoldia magna ATCC 29328]